MINVKQIIVKGCACYSDIEVGCRRVIKASGTIVRYTVLLAASHWPLE